MPITGRPLDGSSVSDHFHRALRQAGLPNVRVHDLRHTAATHLLTRGVHPKVVQDLLGHSTISLTLDTYSHVSPALHAEVPDHMEVLFGGPLWRSRFGSLAREAGSLSRGSFGYKSLDAQLRHLHGHKTDWLRTNHLPFDSQLSKKRDTLCAAQGPKIGQ